jgi:hypothetical protein
MKIALFYRTFYCYDKKLHLVKHKNLRSTDYLDRIHLNEKRVYNRLRSIIQT